MKKHRTIEELEKYLSDFDNLSETGHFQEIEIKDYVFHHKEMTLKEFLSKGRETDMGHGTAFHDCMVEVSKIGGE